MNPRRIVGALLFFASCAAAQPELKYVVVVSRHGVRSPTWTNDRLREYSKDPWPDWSAPPGHLTPHGRELMKQFGAYDRAYLAGRSLWRQTGCADAAHAYFWADTDQRTRETARALAEGLLPGCDVEIHSQPKGSDPLFWPLSAGLPEPDRRLAAAALLGRIGGDPESLLRSYRPAFEELARLLGVPAERLLDGAGSVVPGKADSLVDLLGPMRTASTLAEDLLLEYANGMSGKDLGWGRLNGTNLRRVMDIHVAYTDLARRTPYVAVVYASNLLSHLLDSIRQAATNKPVSGALGKPGDTTLIVVCHDTNIANVAAMLRLSWLLPGYHPDETPPGGALVFELWHDASAGSDAVRVYYTAQSLEQMRDAAAPSLASPPGRAAIFVPGCSSAAAGFPCDWPSFQAVAAAAIDPAFVKK